MKKKNILIVGNGYIASYLKTYKNKFFNIKVISKKNLKIKKKIENIDILVHAVGLNIYNSELNPKRSNLLKKNITVKIIQFCRYNNIRKIIYLSSIHVYKKKLHGEINENSKISNKHPYAIAHRTAEKIFLEKSDSEQRIVIVRLSNLFGICKKTNYLLVINSFLRQAFLSKTIILHNKYFNRDFLPLNYFSLFLKKISFNEKYKIINLGYKTYSLFKLAQIIKIRFQKLFRSKIKIIVQNNKGYLKKYLNYKSINYKKIKNNFYLYKEIDRSLLFLSKKVNN